MCSPPRSPLRYWLHFIDLATCIDGAAAAMGLFTARGSDIPESQASWPHTLYTKAQAYSVMQAMEHVLNSYMAQDFKAGATDEDLQVLRIKLLNLFSAAVIQDNAEMGRLKKERQETFLKEKTRAEMRHRMKMQSANDAYDILTSRVFR